MAITATTFLTAKLRSASRPTIGLRLTVTRSASVPCAFGIPAHLPFAINHRSGDGEIRAKCGDWSNNHEVHQLRVARPPTVDHHGDVTGPWAQRRIARAVLRGLQPERPAAPLGPGQPHVRD